MNLNKMLSSRVMTPAAASGWNHVALWTRSSVASVLSVTISQCDPQRELALGELLLTCPDAHVSQKTRKSGPGGDPDLQGLGFGGFQVTGAFPQRCFKQKNISWQNWVGSR